MTMRSVRRGPDPAGNRARRGTVAGACAVLGVALVVLAAVPAPASQPRRVLTPLQAGLRFYRGKTVVLTEPNSIGGPNYITAIDAVPYLSAYLHATVQVEAIPAGNGILQQDELAAAAPTGLTIGILEFGTDLQLNLTGAAGLNFNPVRLAWLGGTSASPTPIIASPSSPYRTFADLKDAKSPVKTLVVTSGIGAVELRSFFGVMGIPTQWVSGYGSVDAEVAGYQRGDGQVAQITLTDSGPLIASGQARLLAVSEEPPPGANYRQYLVEVPTFTALFKRYPPKTARLRAAESAFLAIITGPTSPFVTQSRVPGDEITALRSAIAWMFRQPGFRSQLLAAGQNPTFVDPFVAKQAYITATSKGKLLTCYIEGAC